MLPLSSSPCSVHPPVMQTIASQQTIPQTISPQTSPLVDQQEICSLRHQRAQNQNAVDLNPSAPINHQALLTTVLAFGIPAFHASLTTKDSAFAFGLNVPVWEAVRSFDSILLAALVAALFKESAQLDPIYWFFIVCSLLQASMGLICSTILIVIFSDGHHRSEYRSIHEDRLCLLFWNIWDHFSLPAISTVWSVLTFMIALVVDAVWPNAAQNNNCSGQYHRNSQFTVAKVMLLLMLFFAAMRVGVFMVHLRHISQALSRPQSA
ncbi:hypothetical protein F5887DRAFT_977445 [Amanita rubescens]|nr:hypothetical protein F5887DRAFT_977445 [Amanita rubescens]